MNSGAQKRAVDPQGCFLKLGQYSIALFQSESAFCDFPFLAELPAQAFRTQPSSFLIYQPLTGFNPLFLATAQNGCIVPRTAPHVFAFKLSDEFQYTYIQAPGLGPAGAWN